MYGINKITCFIFRPIHVENVWFTNFLPTNTFSCKIINRILGAQPFYFCALNWNVPAPTGFLFCHFIINISYKKLYLKGGSYCFIPTKNHPVLLLRLCHLKCFVYLVVVFCRLVKLLNEIMQEKQNKTIIFVETKRKADDIARRMKRDGYVHNFFLAIVVYFWCTVFTCIEVRKF